MAKVGIVGDIHAPYTHEEYRDFCVDIFKAHKIERVVLIGDVVDLHSTSRHAKSPELMGPADEYDAAYNEVQEWAHALRKWKVDVCVGNHDARVFRLAALVGIPARALRSYSSLWDTPDWRWHKHYFKIDKVAYMHGDKACTGQRPALMGASKLHMPVVCGHHHLKVGINYDITGLFGMDVGCGIDHRSPAFDYCGKTTVIQPPMSCGIVDDGRPHLFTEAA